VSKFCSPFTINLNSECFISIDDLIQELLSESFFSSRFIAGYSQMEGSVISGQLLKPRPAGSPPDMSPFFLRQYVKSHANNVFEDYPLLLMEIVLRLPYQVTVNTVL